MTVIWDMDSYDEDSKGVNGRILCINGRSSGNNSCIKFDNDNYQLNNWP